MPPREPLIPTSLATALTSLVGVSATSFITTRDRALDAALAAVVTTVFALVLDRAQRASSWSSLFAGWLSVGSALLSRLRLRLPSCRSRCRPARRDAGPTGFDPDAAPAMRSPETYPHSMRFNDVAARTAMLTWAIRTHGWASITNEPETHSVTRLPGRGIVASPPSDPSGFIRVDGYPVWRAQDGHYVYLRSWVSARDRDWCTNLYLFSDSGAALSETMAAVALVEPDPRCETVCSVCTMDTEGKITRGSSISASRTFEHLFFEQKDELLSLLRRFADGVLFPPHLGEDNKLGILLHGPPGTGKTATVAAIANFLRRSVLQVTAHQIRDRKTMDAVFKNRTELVCLDEFDVLLDVVGRRDDAAAPRASPPFEQGGLTPQQTLSLELLKLAQAAKDDTARADLMKKYTEALEPPTCVDLAFLLGKLQGIESADGRVIVATTNFPDRIDPALTRKGRFDIVLRLGACTAEMVLDTVCHHFGAEAQRGELAAGFAARLPHKALTPAAVVDLCAASESAAAALAALSAAAPLVDEEERGGECKRGEGTGGSGSPAGRVKKMH